MNTRKPPTSSAYALLAQQRSHVLFVLGNSQRSRDREFRKWYLGDFQRSVLKLAEVLRGEQYETHEVDVSGGKYPGLPYQFLGIYDVSVDGASSASGILDHIKSLHAREPSAQPPAVWLYYPVSEAVGRPAVPQPSLLTVAFVNCIPGREDEFREWYATRHIRHALQIPELVSGQCFGRTEFQSPGAMNADFSMIAVYEQEGSPQEMRRSFETIPTGALDFPAMDLKNFAEWVYQPCVPQID